MAKSFYLNVIARCCLTSGTLLGPFILRTPVRRLISGGYRLQQGMILSGLFFRVDILIDGVALANLINPIFVGLCVKAIIPSGMLIRQNGT